jgi:uncharacterized protein YhfF|tara:strand:- start:2036 stop:2599 length:564 start_codon:yes stop_codon:yes gene_type:complete
VFSLLSNQDHKGDNMNSVNRTYAIVGPKIEVSPNVKAIDTFWSSAVADNPALNQDHQVRWIGLDEETTLQIVEYIKSGEKTATFTLPWVNSFNNWANSHVGLPLIILSCHGEPLLVVQITEVIETTFGAIDYSVTGLDGPPVRDTAIWLALHNGYWNEILEGQGMTCTSDMPVLVEKFKPVYPVLTL